MTLHITSISLQTDTSIDFFYSCIDIQSSHAQFLSPYNVLITPICHYEGKNLDNVGNNTQTCAKWISKTLQCDTSDADEAAKCGGFITKKSKCEREWRRLKMNNVLSLCEMYIYRNHNGCYEVFEAVTMFTIHSHHRYNGW